jgi:hypothetical protein
MINGWQSKRTRRRLTAPVGETPAPVQSFTEDTLDNRENDAKIECWLGNLIPWVPENDAQKVQAEINGFRWVDPTNGAARGFNYVNFYSTNDGESIKLLSVLEDRGYFVNLRATPENMGCPPEYRYRMDIMNESIGIHAAKPTISAAISAAVVQLIDKEAESTNGIRSTPLSCDKRCERDKDAKDEYDCSCSPGKSFAPTGDGDPIDEGRGLVCVFCGEGFGYSGQTPDEATLKAAVDHEKECPNNPYKAEIEKLQQEVVQARHEGFATGVVYALARLVEMYDQPSMAGDILRESGVDVRMAAEYDVAFLRKSIPKLAKGRE